MYGLSVFTRSVSGKASDAYNAFNIGTVEKARFEQVFCAFGVYYLQIFRERRSLCKARTVHYTVDVPDCVFQALLIGSVASIISGLKAFMKSGRLLFRKSATGVIPLFLRASITLPPIKPEAPLTRTFFVKCQKLVLVNLHSLKLNPGSFGTQFIGIAFLIFIWI